MTPSSRSPEWKIIRRVRSLKPATYRCPFCGDSLHAMSDHLLVAPDGDLSRRRHAHLECVAAARARGELPTRSEWKRAQRPPRESLRARVRRVFRI